MGLKQSFTLLKRPPNLVTLSGLATMVTYFLLRTHDIRFAPLTEILILVYGYQIADHLDGFLARKLKLTSTFGEFLDLYVDRCADCMFSVMILLYSPEYTWTITVFFLFKLAPEHILGRMIGIADHKNSENTKFSYIYSIFHNRIVLEFYLWTKTFFFVPVVAGVPIPFFEYFFASVIVFRSIFILELFNTLAIRQIRKEEHSASAVETTLAV